MRPRLPHARGFTKRSWRKVTVGLRALPDFLVIGTARGGTTSLYSWLCTFPQVAPASQKELHYFDLGYQKGRRWYRARFPIRRPGRITGEATPDLLYHPLAPERVARDLPQSTRFVVLLREPTERAISAYWLERKLGRETETLDVAIDTEQQRLTEGTERRRRFARQHFSYMERGEYATQLRRWFAVIDRSRFLIVESEQLYGDPATAARIAAWLGLPPPTRPFPALNDADRHEPTDPELLTRMKRHFEPHNRELFELLGTVLWDPPPPEPPPSPDSPVGSGLGSPPVDH